MDPNRPKPFEKNKNIPSPTQDHCQRSKERERCKDVIDKRTFRIGWNLKLTRAEPKADLRVGLSGHERNQRNWQFVRRAPGINPGLPFCCAAPRSTQAYCISTAFIGNNISVTGASIRGAQSVLLPPNGEPRASIDVGLVRIDDRERVQEPPS
jgi:hypothetical protein